MPMSTSSRLYHCLRCQAQVVICRQCDHGQHYCPGECAKAARIQSLNRARQKYQSSRKGRFNNALRQQRFRERTKQNSKKETEQGSLQKPSNAVLIREPEEQISHFGSLKKSTLITCQHCGCPCEPFFRMAFVIVLSWSRHIFLRFYLNQKMENFLRGHVAAFERWQGIPRVLLYDNGIGAQGRAG